MLIQELLLLTDRAVLVETVYDVLDTIPSENPTPQTRNVNGFSHVRVGEQPTSRYNAVE